MRILIVTAVAAEAEAIGRLEGARLVVAGVGRVNAAAATTEALVREAPAQAVLSAGVAGALPASGLELGQALVASACVYAEEGLMSPEGFRDVAAMRLTLGDFPGNVVPVAPELLARLDRRFRTAPIATVATCSGTDAAAREVERRTGAAAEAMEGAAVVHAARRLGAPAIELRTISNTTGARDRQRWDLPGALRALGTAVRAAVEVLREPAPAVRR
jgi:futalosine hydrolase